MFNALVKSWVYLNQSFKRQMIATTVMTLILTFYPYFILLSVGTNTTLNHSTLIDIISNLPTYIYDTVDCSSVRGFLLSNFGNLMAFHITNIYTVPANFIGWVMNSEGVNYLVLCSAILYYPLMIYSLIFVYKIDIRMAWPRPKIYTRVFFAILKFFLIVNTLSLIAAIAVRIWCRRK